MTQRWSTEAHESSAVASRLGRFRAALIGGLVLWVLVSPLPAYAHNGLPDDLAGYEWTGTISTAYDVTNTHVNSSQGSTRERGSVTYTALRSLRSQTGDDRSYETTVEGFESQEDTFVCPSVSQASSMYHSNETTVSGQYPFETKGPTIGIVSRPDGFALHPYDLSGPTKETQRCTGTGGATVVEYDGGHVGGFQSGRSGEALLKQDTDPDPYHLVGTTTWTLQQPPMPLYEVTTAYSYSVTYDLRLVRKGPLPPPTDPACENARGGYTTRDFRGSVPGRDLFLFSPSVKYRFTETCAEILQAWSHGGSEWGLDTVALELLGFKVRFDEENRRGWDSLLATSPAQDVVSISGGHDILNPPTALLSGDFDVQFDWTALIAKLKVPDRLKKSKYRDALAADISAAIGKLPLVNRNVITLVEQGQLRRQFLTEVQWRIIREFDKALERHLKGPEFMRKGIRDFVMKTVDVTIRRTDRAFNSANGNMRTKIAGRLIADQIIQYVLSFANSALPNQFSVWTPDVRVTVRPGGLVSYSDDGWHNPFLAVSIVPGSDQFDTQGAAPDPTATREPTKRATKAVAVTVARTAGEELSPSVLAAGKPIGVRVPVQPGRIDVTVTDSGGGAARAAARRATVLARGSTRATSTKWVRLALRPTPHARRAARTKKRMTVTITVVYRPDGAAPKTSKVRIAIT